MEANVLWMLTIATLQQPNRLRSSQGRQLDTSTRRPYLYWKTARHVHTSYRSENNTFVVECECVRCVLVIITRILSKHVDIYSLV